MEPILTFDVTNQHIRRTDSFRVVAKSRNYLHAQFCFLTEEWKEKEKTALFGSYPVILSDDGTCLVPWEILTDPGTFSVSVFAGDLITTDRVFVRVYESGYREDLSESSPATPDLLAQLMELLHKKADGICYENSVLTLLSGEDILSSIKFIVKDGREVELRNTGEEIQWRYAEEVFCDGELVYTGTVEDTPETMILPADPVVEKQPEAKGPATERYRLKTLMNVRKKPSLYAEVLSTKPKDTVVHVLGVEDDWLHLIDGSFILFEDGKYAEKI